MKKKSLIISLIKDDLINSKLINTLNQLGLEADHYSLYLTDKIFILLKLNDREDSDDLFHFYIQQTEKVVHLDVKNQSEYIDQLAEEIYESLLARQFS